MRLTVELPDDLVTKPDSARLALEALVIAGYRCGEFNESDVARLLGLARLQVDDFLGEHGVEEYAYDQTDLERDRRAVLEMRSERLLHQ